MSREAAIAAVDSHFDRFAAAHRIPGIAYGVLLDGKLAHNRGLGTTTVGEQRPPDPGTIFRIASMTKSFTAAAVMLLRDEGRLRLDDPVGIYVPQVAGLRPTSDSPLITVRHLLAMNAGFPTDDPWADRQQPLSLDRFSELLHGGENCKAGSTTI